MDRGKRLSKTIGGANTMIYMDLKEIIREHALPYLPAKALYRFIGVCRDWKVQISTPFFVHNQSNSFRSISGLFCQLPGSPLSLISLDPMAYGVPDPQLKFLPEPVDIRASSNGLLCCQGHTGERAYYVCNPVNQQWRKLPKPNADHGTNPALVLIFEPSILNFVPDYKLVCAFPSTDFDNGYEFEVYSSLDDSWKVSAEICFGNRTILPRSGVHVNGVVYWASTGSMVAFDLTIDRSQIIPYYALGLLSVMNGKLCLSSLSGSTLTISELNTIHASTMQMHSNTKTWEVRHRIQLNGAGFRHGLPDGRHHVLCAEGDVAMFHAGGEIFSYNMKTKETMAISGGAAYDDRCIYIPYVNSLVSL
ncbi:hypothetical protein Ancab_026138 [Ancistrocladus abbreviatus]